jgi:uncharacterized protein YegL
MSNDEAFLLRRRLETTTKELEGAAVSKKRFGWLALGLLLLLILILGTIYKITVLDYAEIENVKIEQQGNTQKINFAFDVKSSGRLNFCYGETVLVDRKKVGKNQIFHWALDEEGTTEISIRSRNLLFPKWHSKVFHLLPPLPKNIALLIDCSGSMANQYSPITGEIIMKDVKQAAFSFLDCIDNKTKVSLISFGKFPDYISETDALQTYYSTGVLPGETRIEVELTWDHAELKRKIDALSPEGGTPIGSAIALACNKMLRESSAENIIVLLTDGIPDDPSITELYAEQAKTGIKIITIGVGPGVDSEFLKRIASTPDDYYFASESFKLKSIFADIANELSASK